MMFAIRSPDTRSRSRESLRTAVGRTAVVACWNSQATASDSSVSVAPPQDFVSS
jgi:hypothetical protein